MNQDRVPINEIGTRDEDEGAAPQAAHRQGLVIHPCASFYPSFGAQLKPLVFLRSCSRAQFRFRTLPSRQSEGTRSEGMAFQRV